jgi:hypothetical protein
LADLGGDSGASLESGRLERRLQCRHAVERDVIVAIKPMPEIDEILRERLVGLARQYEELVESIVVPKRCD